MSFRNFRVQQPSYAKIKHSDWLKKSHVFEHPIREVYVLKFVLTSAAGGNFQFASCGVTTVLEN